MSPQSTISHYRIIARLGEGGMGVVYRAFDTKLNREVAIKVLPDHFASSGDRLARFTREAQVLASLEHPGIAAIYGIEERALVMELVNGPTLADRLARGKLSVDETLDAARQIAEALEHAHTKGVIHRDLKPANIKFDTAGKAKLLDFGLAKAFDSTPTADTSTVTMDATIAGVVMGTPGYMSPEQAAGRPVDKRTDTWAFGIILYEMLVGRRPDGTSPDWTALPAATPSNIRRVLRLCLQIHPANRLRDIGDARILLGETPDTPVARPGAAWRRWLPWAISAALASVLVAGALRIQRKAPDAAVARFTVAMPSGSLNADLAVQNVPSPDGASIAMVVFDPKLGKQLIWLRDLRSLGFRALEQTEGANYPFWSPDGASIGFFAGGNLKKVSVATGASKTLCDAGGPGDGAAWGRNETIVFSSSRGPLMQVSSAGGVATPVTSIDETAGEMDHVWPQFLPDGRLLYLARNTDRTKNAIYVQEPGKGHRPTLVMKSRYRAAFVFPGYLLYTRLGTLFAQPLDLKTVRMQGEPVRVAEDIADNDNNGNSTFAVSESGVLTYRARVAPASRQLTWYDRRGNRLKVVGPPRGYAMIALSPDEKNLAATGLGDSPETSALWLLNLQSEEMMRLTPGPRQRASFPVWSSDSKSIALNMEGGLWNVDVASGASRLLSADPNASYPYDWSSDGKYLICTPGGGAKPSLLSLEGGGKVSSFFVSPVVVRGFRFSPDGRWVAYFMNESGQDQVYVAAFPSLNPKRQLSTTGGRYPIWQRDGKELYFVTPDSTLMAAEIRTGSSMEVSFPKPLFKLHITQNLNQYVPSADGQKILVSERVGDQPLAEVTVVLNWLSELKK